jgi:hypothetical protein
MATVVAVVDEVKAERSPWRWLIPFGVAVVLLGLLIGLIVGGWRPWRPSRVSTPAVPARTNAVEIVRPPPQKEGNAGGKPEAGPPVPAPRIVSFEMANVTPTSATARCEIADWQTNGTTKLVFTVGRDSGTHTISSREWSTNLTGLVAATNYNVLVSLYTNDCSAAESNVVFTTTPFPLPSRAELDDRLPNIPTYFVRANEQKADIKELLKKHNLKIPPSCQVMLTNGAFIEFPLSGGGETNIWNDRTLRQGTKNLFSFENGTTTLRRLGTNFTAAAFYFTCTPPFALLYFESNCPWQRPATLSMTNLHSGIDAGFADYSLAEGLKDRLKQLLPYSEQHRIIFRFQAAWLTNICVAYQRPALYTNTWSTLSTFAQRFSPRTTGEALTAATNDLFKQKTIELQKAQSDARHQNILLKGKWLTAGNTLLVNSWDCTPRDVERSFLEFLKQEDSTKGDSYNPSWSDYCRYLQTLLKRLQEQQFPEPKDEKGKKDYRDQVLPTWNKIMQLVQSATNTQEAVEIVKNKLPKELGTLSRKYETGWTTQFGNDQLEAAFNELKKISTTADQVKKYDDDIAAIANHLKSLPKVEESWGAIWLEVQVNGTNWWPLIEFKDEGEKKK